MTCIRLRWLHYNRKLLFLPPPIHFLVILLVVTAGDVVHPLLVVEIPSDGFLNAFLELQAGLPAKFALQFAAVDSIAQIVAGAVGDIGDEVHVFSFLATQKTVGDADEHLHDIDVFPLVEAAYVIGLGVFTLVENEIDGTRVVFHIEPVAHILSLSIYGQGLAQT